MEDANDHYVLLADGVFVLLSWRHCDEVDCDKVHEHLGYSVGHVVLAVDGDVHHDHDKDRDLVLVLNGLVLVLHDLVLVFHGLVLARHGLVFVYNGLALAECGLV